MSDMATGSVTKSRVTKAEQSRATRQRIVAAATTLFLRDGFLTATMSAIAKEAGVAVQTLYLSFANKTAILSAAFDTAVAGDDEPIPIVEREWYKTMTSDPSGPASVASFFQASASIIERSTGLYAVIRAASAEPEVAELLANNKRERHAALAGVAARLAQKKGFRKALTAEDATGIMYTLSSSESYLLLVTEHGWSPEQWRRWTLTALTDQLFGKTPTP
jgi:AcrR family transcriptional regulator